MAWHSEIDKFHSWACALNEDEIGAQRRPEAQVSSLWRCEKQEISSASIFIHGFKKLVMGVCSRCIASCRQGDKIQVVLHGVALVTNAQIRFFNNLVCIVGKSKAPTNAESRRLRSSNIISGSPICSKWSPRIITMYVASRGQPLNSASSISPSIDDAFDRSASLISASS